MRLIRPDAPDHSPSSTVQASDSAAERTIQRVAIVVPVYQGERTLGPLVQEILPLTQVQRTPDRNLFRVTEVILVHDGAIDGSDRVMAELAARYAFVTPVWLSRNFGQHPATLAGMASTTAEWVVTMDEDGQQDPADIGRMLDCALAAGAPLVYARPSNPPPHGWLRNRLSSLAKWAFTTVLGTGEIGQFNSFRLVEGEIARSLAAYCGPHVYLDAALSWLVARSAHCDVVVRPEGDRPSGYNFRKLCRHFWRLVLTSGTKPLRVISLLGTGSILASVLISLYALWYKFTAQAAVQGWTSLIILICFFSGCILLSLGIIAEYLGITLMMTMGKPLYLVVSRPQSKKAA